MGGLFKRKFFRYGVPFFILVIAGSFGLTEITSLRYKFRAQKGMTKEEAEKIGVKMKNPGEVTLESEFEKTKKELNIDEWENKRGPRPWEMTEEDVKSYQYK